MKTVPRMIVLVLLAFFGERVRSQSGLSTFGFSNVGFDRDAPVFDSEGTRLFGTNFLAMVYGGSTMDSLFHARYRDSSRLAEPALFTRLVGGQARYFLGESFVNVPTDRCGVEAWLQVRVWDARLGASYEEVMSLGIGGYGESNLFRERGGDPCIPEPGPPRPLYGLESFSLRPVIPEPSAVWLLLLGAPYLLWLCRRRK